VILAVDVVTETGVLKGVFAFGGVNVRLRQAIEADGLSFDDFGVGGRLGECAVQGIVLWSSQDVTF